MNGKTYMLISCLTALLFIVIPVLTAFLFHTGIVQGVIGLAKQDSLMYPLLSLLIGFGGLVLWGKAAERRIRTRDLI